MQMPIVREQIGAKVGMQDNRSRQLGRKTPDAAESGFGWAPAGARFTALDRCASGERRAAQPQR
jgi:hypothetical protein